MNYPLPVTPGPRPHKIFFKAIGVRIPCQIEPGPREAFAVMRRSQKAIHHAFVSVRPRIGQKLAELLRRRWQSAKVEAGATQQRRLGRFRRRRGALFGQASHHELIDRIAHPSTLNSWRHRACKRLKGPVLLFRDHGDSHFAMLRPRIDPLAQNGHFGRRQSRPHRRHHEAFFGREHALHQGTLRGLAGHNHRTGVTALQHRRG